MPNEKDLSRFRKENPAQILNPKEFVKNLAEKPRSSRRSDFD